MQRRKALCSHILSRRTSSDQRRAEGFQKKILLPAVPHASNIMSQIIYSNEIGLSLSFHVNRIVTFEFICEPLSVLSSDSPDTLLICSHPM